MGQIPPHRCRVPGHFDSIEFRFSVGLDGSGFILGHGTGQFSSFKFRFWTHPLLRTDIPHSTHSSHGFCPTGCPTGLPQHFPCWTLVVRVLTRTGLTLVPFAVPRLPWVPVGSMPGSRWFNSSSSYCLPAVLYPHPSTPLQVWLPTPPLPVLWLTYTRDTQDSRPAATPMR